MCAGRKAFTDVMVKFEGSEAFRQGTWVLIEELHSDGWHIGGEPFAGPPSLMGTLGRSKDVFEMIDGTPTSRDEFAAALPPVNASEQAANLHAQKSSRQKKKPFTLRQHVRFCLKLRLYS